MPCLATPSVTLPTLPAPLTLAPPALPDITLPTFCCKLPPIPIQIPPIPIPPLLLNPAIIATLNGYIAVLQSYLQSLPLKCPLE